MVAARWPSRGCWVQEKVVHCCICGDPNSVLHWQQLIREGPILSNIEPKQIKAWFPEPPMPG